MKSKYYIVNDMDRPCERLIAAHREGEDGLFYVHPELRHIRKQGMSDNDAVPLDDFGIKLTEAENGESVLGVQIGPSVATYPSGEFRPWQGSYSFLILL